MVFLKFQLLIICCYLEKYNFVNIDLASCTLAKLINSSSFYRFFKISTQIIMSPVHKDSFTSSSSSWVPLISFSCLITLVRTSSTTVNRRGETSCLVPDLPGKVFSVAPLRMMLAIVFHRCPLSGWGRFLLILVFIKNWCWIFVRYFSCI